MASLRNATDFDRELSLRHWSGQDRQSASAALGVSVSTCRRRERVLELPAVCRLTPHFDPSIAERNISAAGYILKSCRAHKAHGLEFHFWTHPRELRYISKHAVETLLRHKQLGASDPSNFDTLSPVRVGASESQSAAKSPQPRQQRCKTRVPPSPAGSATPTTRRASSG